MIIDTQLLLFESEAESAEQAVIQTESIPQLEPITDPPTQEESHAASLPAFFTETIPYSQLAPGLHFLIL